MNVGFVGLGQMGQLSQRGFQIPPIVAPIDGDQQRALGGGVGL